MSKRQRTSGGSVTGGTGDVKPQYLTVTSLTAGAVDDYVVNQIALPVPRFGTMKTKATIMEMLSVDWYLNLEGALDDDHIDMGFLATVTSRSDGDTITAASIAADAADPLVFGLGVVNINLLTTGGWAQTMPLHIDMTDNNGNGILVATDRIFVVGGSVNNNVAGSYVAKIKYRLVNVGITEYVGIVQSQQG